MSNDKKSFPPVALVIVVFLAVTCLVLLPAGLIAQAKKKKPATRPLLWESVNVAQEDLYLGPGGGEMQPDLSQITFIKQETGGFSTKY